MSGSTDQVILEIARLLLFITFLIVPCKLRIYRKCSGQSYDIPAFFPGIPISSNYLLIQSQQQCFLPLLWFFLIISLEIWFFLSRNVLRSIPPFHSLPPLLHKSSNSASLPVMTAYSMSSSPTLVSSSNAYTQEEWRGRAA